MKYAFKYIFAFTFIFYSCSKDELTIDKTEIEISQKKVRIGDTIIVKGKNLDIVTRFTFSGTKAESFLISSEEMKVIVPILYNEDFDLITYRNLQVIDSTPMKLIGTFPLSYDFPYETISGIKMVNEKTIYISVDTQLYKTIDGGYNWIMLKEFSRYIGENIFFIDENEGWVGVNENNRFILYHTIDGGSTFNQIFERGFSYNPILNIYFSTPTNGYLVSRAGEIYHSNDNRNFDLIYNFSTSPVGDDFSFNNFSFYNNNLIATGDIFSGGTSLNSVVVQRINNIFSYTLFNIESETGIWDVQIIDESQVYMSYNNNIFFKDITTSDNWEEKFGNQSLTKFHFISEDKGIGIINFRDVWGGNSIVFETYDGGINWINKLEFLDTEYAINIDFYNNVGFITGARGKIWKHIFE